MCTSGCGSGCFKALWCILSLILGASDQMNNLFRFFCSISSLQVIAEADVLGSCCVRFLLCKVLVVSLIIDFLRKSLREEIF